MALFLLALVIPWIIQIGPTRMSVYRIVLLATLLPTLFMWASGKAGKIRTADIALLLYSLWGALSLAVNHGFSLALQPSGILFIETAGPYFLARCYVRDADDYYNVISLLFKIVVVTLPFAIVESISNRNVLLELFSQVLPTPRDTNYDPRWGLRRVQGYFEHPILFGVVMSSILAPVYLVLGYRQSLLKRSVKTGIVAAATFLSMSAGPVTSITAQALLLTWNRVLGNYKERWKLLWGMVLALYVFVELASNQSVPEFFMTHFSFDEGSAYYRVLIWRYGSTTVVNHPLFGVGMNEWERPDWMPASIDMYWLIHAIMYGLPAGLMMMLAFSSIFTSVSFKKGLNAKLVDYRYAFLFSMTGFFLVGWTVHFWNATYVLFLFLLGSGVWLLDAKPEGDAAEQNRPRHRRAATRGHAMVVEEASA
ncbi:O-antigen ligase family protein [Microvirga sp. 2MCAF38]|uniref:O-antigen ligase family protein n=1 Tax=Microvirga sp. 2MCAF38 TaxID=3232989 RepID=UPI003F9B4DE3